MSANSGYNTGFSSISNDHLYLYVTNDKLFNTDIEYANLYSRNIVDDESKEIEKVLPYQINKELSNIQISNSIQQNSTPNKQTIYDIISQTPELSEIKNVIELSGGFKTYLSENSEPQGITFFAPINGYSKEIFNYLNKNIEMYPEYKTSSIQELLKAHTTNFSIDPSRLVGVKNKIFTLANGFVFYTDGTKNDKINIYLHSYINYHFDKMKENKIIPMLKYIKTDNGSLYIINGILTPDIVIPL
jgi:hypothetical protein